MELLDRVSALVGSRPVDWVRGAGGYSIAQRWSLDLEDGRRVFAKMAPNDDIAWRIRDEYRYMSMVDERLRCRVYAWEDGERPMLVLEDFRDARWPPPWEADDLDHVLATLDRIWSTPATGLEACDRFAPMFAGWESVAKDAAGFLSLNIASPDWIDRCLPTLIEAARGAPLVGDDFLHMDLRSDNLCFAGERVVLVDWNWAVRGPRALDLSFALPSIRLEGGPLPEEIAPGMGAYAAAFSAVMAAGAPLPPPEGAPMVRRFQLRQLRISLPWACRELGLPPPDVRYAQLEIDELDAQLADGEIDEQRWHEGVEEVLIDAYLASDDPRGQSGKSGDEAEWRWARELVLDAFPPAGSFLDVGCANGYLMESVHRWAQERGMEIEPYGLDISWRIAALARHRLPQWADRIWVGNVIDWQPPRRFDVVQSGLCEGTPRRRREVVDRIQREFLVPGGVHVFRPDRVLPGQPDGVDQLRAIGLEPDGVIDAIHPDTGDVRRTAWLRAR